MDITHAIILAIVEGITEFLPISSTGHLVLAAHALELEHTNFLKSFEIIIQLGAILAIVALYWKRLMQGPSLWLKIFAAFLPTAIVGFTLYPIIKGVLLGNPMITVAALFLGGVALIVLELLYKEKEHHAESIEDLSFFQSFLIGIFQSLSVIPGVSRAASTIIGGLFVGAKRQTAVEFSFLLAVPTMVAASMLDLIQSKLAFTQEELLLLVIGFVGSFLVAIAAVKFLLHFIKHHTFIPFGIYRIVLSVLYWFFLLR